MAKKTEQPAVILSSKQKNTLKTTFLTSPEGLLLLLGAVLAFVYTFWLGAKLVLSPENSQVLVGMTATQIIFGRAAGMAFGYSLSLGHKTVIAVCIIIETIMLLIFYPLFVLSWRHLLVINWLKNIFERIRNVAESNKGVVQKYGIIGLFVFVWFPFWMTGPLVGCVIGFLLGLRIWINLAAVLAGTYIAIFCWGFFLRRFHEQVISYSSYAAIIPMVLLVVIIFIAGNHLYRTLHENKNRAV